MSSAADATELSASQRIVLLTDRPDAPGWVRTALTGAPVESVHPAVADALLRDRLDGAVAVIIDAGIGAPLSVARRAHRLCPAAQLVIVACPEELQDLNRSMLFTPGIGEVWVVSPSEATAELFERAAAVGAKRRRHALRSAEVSRRLAQVRQSPERPPIMADQYLAVLVELLPEPVLALAEDDEVIFRNPAAAEVLRLKKDERIDGRELRTRLAPVEPAALDDLLERARNGVARVELRLGEGPNQRMYDAVAAPVRGERPVRALVLHDVTAQVRTRERLEDQAIELEQQKETLQFQNEELQAQAEELQRQAEELQAQAEELALRNEENQRLAAARAEIIAERDGALAELEAAARHRSRFYASMSHELRTPLNAIIGYNELVRTGVYGAVAEKQREVLVRIERAAKHLHELLNDVLDLSKLEAGKLVLDPALVQVEELVTDLAATMGPLADEHDVELRYHIGPGCVDAFVTDPRRLRQILMNLLSNAIRYGSSAPVEIRCARSENRLRVEVEDRGPGIAAEHLEAIFQEFVQVGEGERGGTGLGLPIARTLARQMGGDLTVRSQPGKGSIFSLEVPSLEVEPPENAPAGS